MTRPVALFLINLVQDVAVLRPLIVMATSDMGFDARLLISNAFQSRDRQGVWSAELDALASDTGCELAPYGDPLDAFAKIDGAAILFSASESHLPNHRETHDIMRIAPPHILRVTLQHGYECVGFRHSAAHRIAHGDTAFFAADVIAGWAEAEHLPSLAPSQARKLVATGPTSVLQLGPPSSSPDGRVLVCENLHSVRFRGAEEALHRFPTIFGKFCLELEDDGPDIVLRPHPGGQYMLRNSLPIPGNATVELAPIYRGGLSGFACGISAPSSVVIDMLLARIPTALWVDAQSGIDASGYEGLTQVGSADEWLAFVRDAMADPAPFLEMQDRFLEQSGLILDPQTIYSRFADLFQSARRLSEPS